MGDWTIPLTSRLLIDGAFLDRLQSLERRVAPEYDNPAMISVTEQALGNFIYRTVNQAGANPALRTSWWTVRNLRASASYITGAHSFKAGFNYGRRTETNWLGNRLPGAQFVS